MRDTILTTCFFTGVCVFVGFLLVSTYILRSNLPTYPPEVEAMVDHIAARMEAKKRP